MLSDSSPGAQLRGRASPSLPPVMVLGDHFGYPGGVPHGVTSYFLQVLPALRDAGIDLTVCLLREPHPAADTLRAQGIRPTFLCAKKWDPSVVMRVATLARERGTGLLHATGLKGTLVARLAGRLVGAAIILHTHDLNEPRGSLGFLQGLAARPTDMAVCVSEAVRNVTVRGYHVLPERVRVIHNGIKLKEILDIPPETRSRVREELRLGADQPVLAMVGRMHAVKGHRAMLTMLPPIVKRCPRAVLLLVGDGPERATCEKLAQELHVGQHLRFLGHRTDVPRLLAAVDLVVMPSESEGLGLAAIEALAARRAVIAFDVGGLREVVTDDVTGRLVPAGDRQAFVEAVVSTIQDAERRSRYGERALVDSKRFSLEFHVRELIACYREAATPGAGRSARAT